MAHCGQYFINENSPASIALWRLISLQEKTIFVTDREERVYGFLTMENFPCFSEQIADLPVGEICRKDVKTVPQHDAYIAARNLAAQFPSVRLFPVIDGHGKAVDLLRRWQLFFKEEYFAAVRGSQPVGMPYPYYAAAIWRSAEVATAVGIDKTSVVEFGVANGDGLLACELLCREIASIFGLTILVYGFDGGTGLPGLSDWRDCPQCWNQGQFPMDRKKLQSRLQDARLILGPLQETCSAFQPEAPIGAMLVDVDFYSSTLPILAMLEGETGHFLPIVNMYFDDIGGSLEFQGETLAIREFNQRNTLRKISPELESFGEFNFHGRRYGFSKLKACMLYDHPDFSESGFKNKIMHDFWR